MAATVSFLVNTVFGNKRVIVANIHCSGTTSNMLTGFNAVDGANVCLGYSCATAETPKIATLNVGETATAIAGSVLLKGTVDGSVYVVTAYGH